ncbi:hypothetical protein PENTCL1PPCAC_4465, partial [Pristionchus entomophagus]
IKSVKIRAIRTNLNRLIFSTICSHNIQRHIMIESDSKACIQHCLIHFTRDQNGESLHLASTIDHCFSKSAKILSSERSANKAVDGDISDVLRE